ncbi:MAG: hypothetical protein HUU21_30560, partial [Polyangiaceae bacterium]|nr:hypothetical protein [Polyangiaceae bacterium]
MATRPARSTETAPARTQRALAVALRALDEVGGPALVLDNDLRILATTPGAERVLGEPVTPGSPAAKLLCGEAVERPIA